MGLWSAGKIEGLTFAMIRKVCAQAYNDHREGSEYPMLLPSQMQINEIELPIGDQPFDRISHARWNNETFRHDGREWRVSDYGAGWKIVCTHDETIARQMRDEEELAKIIVATCGNHPDPFIARIELTYNNRGNRAGYGIRKSGKAEIFYN